MIDGEEIREAGALYAQIGAWALGKPLLDPLPAVASNVYPGQRPRYAVISRGKDDDVQFVLSVAGLDALGSDLLDRCLAHVDQQDVVTVVHFVVPGLAWDAFGAEGMVLGHQHLRHHAVPDALTYLVYLRVARLDLVHPPGVDRAVAERRAVVCSALEDGQMGDLVRDCRD